MKMKLIIGSALLLLICSCHQKTIGYLLTEDAGYLPDTMVIRKTLDPQLDSIRIESRAPWVSLAMQGYEGTELIVFSIENITSTAGEEAIRYFKENLSIRGAGTMLFPIDNDAVPGRYVISVRLTNPGYTQVVNNAFTFIVEP
ncbi:hypothetical protein [Gabonibacter chumensis]|uniref:hypothetical protein n=1 Tax=Gabonibacter chumensis TaxID=2972474 RepID=UPI002572C0D2|nr:hypothetical protein [Gabonibacter chumensis]MCR9012520.1 hypothetical protein [Gabonibacter chumensis]